MYARATETINPSPCSASHFVNTGQSMSMSLGIYSHLTSSYQLANTSSFQLLPSCDSHQALIIVVTELTGGGLS